MATIHAERGTAANVFAAGELEEGLVALQDWLGELYERRLARYDDQGVVQIDDAVAARFALVFVGGIVLVAIPSLEALWARVMPWEYAAMYRARQDLFLVAESMQVDGAPTPRLGVSFRIAAKAKAEAVRSHGTLELRAFAPEATPQRPRIAPRAFARIPIVILEEEDNVLDIERGVTRKAAMRSRG